MPEETVESTDPAVDAADAAPEEILSADDVLAGVGSFEEEQDETATNVAKTPVAGSKTEETDGSDIAEDAGAGGDVPPEPSGAGDLARGQLQEQGGGDPVPQAAPVPPTEQPAAPAVDPRIQAYADWKRENADLMAKLRTGALDPIDNADEFKKALQAQAVGQDLLDARHEAIEERQQADAQWHAWHADNADVPLGKARAMFNQCVRETASELPDAGPQSIQRMATKMFGERLKTLREQAKPVVKAPPTPPAPPKPVVKKPPVTPNGGRILPKSNTAARPGVPSSTPEDYLVKNGSGFKDFLG